MKKLLLPCICLIAVFVVSCSSDSNDAKSYVEENYNHSVDELEAMDLINDYRVSQNLPPLQIIEHISYVASTHNNYMITNDTLNHFGFDERKQNLADVIGAYRVGENVAMGFSSPETVINSWISSEGHRTIIEGDYTHFGLSIKKNNNNKSYYTNILVKK